MFLTNENKIRLLRKYLKLKILEDNATFRGHNLERAHVYDIMKKAITNGESHSALIIGPRGCGKTTLINSVLSQLASEVDLNKDAIVVKLNGLIHHDEKIALKAITAQMQLENAVGDRVFGTFAENLSFLLSCLQSGADRKCQSMLFILEELDQFCHSGRTQTLLYNLFDITHSQSAPMCVLGITSRIDLMDLLEKRVKSRFSHRHIFIFPNEITEQTNFQTSVKSPLDHYLNLLVTLLSLPQFQPNTIKKKKNRRSEAVKKDDHREYDHIEPDHREFAIPIEVLNRCKVDAKQFEELDGNFVEDWNGHVKALVDDERVVDGLEKLCYFSVNEQIFRDVLFRTITSLRIDKPHIDPDTLCRAIDTTVAPEQTVSMLTSLSVLELSLVIAMKHASDIFDGEPMNFEMVYHRYTKFANTNSSAQSVPRPVVLKAFEHLRALEIIAPLKQEGKGSADTTSRAQKEYQLFTLGVCPEDVSTAVKLYRALPTEIAHWANTSD